MTKEIIWTNPADGKTWITIPAGNIYVPVDIQGQPPKKALLALLKVYLVLLLMRLFRQQKQSRKE